MSVKSIYRSLSSDKKVRKEFLKIVECFEYIDSVSRGKYNKAESVKLKLRIHSFLSRCVANGGDLNLQESNGRNLLFHAASKLQKEFVQELCEFKVDMNRKDLNGSFPLLNAVDKLNSEVAVCLIGNGADVNMQDSKGKTALMQCIIERNVTIFDKLMETKKCKLDLQDEKGLTALHLVIMFCKRHPSGAHFLGSLIEQKASVTIVDCEGKSPLVKCIETKNMWGIDALLIVMKKEEINKTYNNLSYLAYSVSIGEIDVAIAMIKNHSPHLIDLNATFHPGENVFPLAVESNSLPLVKELAENGCDFRSPHPLGYYTIEHAFHESNIKPGFDVNIIKYFIDKYLALGDMTFMLEKLAGNKCSEYVINFCGKNTDTRAKIGGAYKSQFMLLAENRAHLLNNFYNFGGYDLINLFITYLC
ncbi:MAG: hypothetical protein Hyperionvirus1_27 [Hyperionvirus sp.]|uniref:Uncharacterized protein n=1 Tax=Hyperionvirus sp. TaxID=2487770 RepID=A0A3G5A5J0_9VIRU|nr:MAG: hypothetical protein Hyperionvirus1_27 [Hyperionvirus sp.]